MPKTIAQSDHPHASIDAQPGEPLFLAELDVGSQVGRSLQCVLDDTRTQFGIRQVGTPADRSGIVEMKIHRQQTGFHERPVAETKASRQPFEGLAERCVTAFRSYGNSLLGGRFRSEAVAFIELGWQKGDQFVLVHEVAQSVEDRPPLINFHTEDLVQTMHQEDVGAPVDGFVGEVP